MDAAYYDSQYGHADAQSSGYYDKDYWQSHYFPLYRAAVKEVQRLGCKSILEIGCGSGGFAHLLFDTAKSVQYHGIDFSSNAVERARKRTGKTEAFSVANAQDDNTISEYPHDTIVCMEVLEHIEDDRETVMNWAPGTTCVCSVPNFDSPDHVRIFESVESVTARYGDLIDIENAYTVPRALVRGRGWGEYFRQLRWSRNDPRKFMAMLGYKTFENLAGWVVFTGKRI